MLDIDIAWAAGILEGEGHFSLSQKRSTTGLQYPVIAIRLGMTDQDVVLRVRDVFGVGTLRGPISQKNPKHKPFFTWQVSNKKDIDFVCRAILPYMGLRRSEKIHSLLENTAPIYPWRHGTRQGYEVHKCKCELCRENNTIRHRKIRAKLRNERELRENVAK